MGKSKEEDLNQRTTLEKIQDTSRDIFVSLFILVILVIPTTYIGVRSFQPMTVPGYENTTFVKYLIDQFTFHLDQEVQQVALLKIFISPYKADVDLLVQIFSQTNKSSVDQRVYFSWHEIPNAWWTGIQKESIAVFQTIKRLYPKDYKN